MQFVQLWALIQNVQLNEDVEDDIRWKLMGNGQYSMAFAYKLQLFNLLNPLLTRLFGKRGLHQRWRTTLGWHCKIDFGRRIDCGGMVGRIAGYAHFANKPKKVTTTSSSIAATPLWFGSFWRCGLAPKAMGGPRHQRVVALYGGGIKPAPKGFGFTHLANRLGDLEREER
jgi:hypothetical protein